jgi:cation diffusion facilitator CzcD-associated flavoprotein CzcO
MSVTKPSQPAAPATLPTHVDVAVIGAGFGGLAMAKRLLDEGMEDFVLLEKADDVGGTWRDNTYPGAACDVPSHVYSLSFAPNPDWSAVFSRQDEIFGYLRRVSEEHGIAPHIRFGCEVSDAAWQQEDQRWRIETSQGTMTARVLVAAAGPFAAPSVPELPGLENFQGASFHSADWDHDFDLEGKRVAVVGTGASAIQFVPEIQPRVAKLHLFQRTAPWITRRNDRRLTRIEKALFRRFPSFQQQVRRFIFWSWESRTVMFIRRPLAEIMRRAALAHIHIQVRDPELRRKVTPDFTPGCKRMLMSNTYYPALAAPNAEVVTDGIAEIRANSIVDAAGVEREVDAIIWGTGFNVTDPPVANHVRGADGRTLADHWQGSMQAYRGTTVAGFPNMFFLLGPNTGLGSNSVVAVSEAQADYAVDALRQMEARGIGAVEPLPQAQAAFNKAVQAGFKGTVWEKGVCASWYRDASGRNTTLWPDFSYRLHRRLARFDMVSYRTELAREPEPEPAAKPAEVAA